MCRIGARSNAIGYADSPIGIAGKRQAGKLSQQVLNSLYPFEMAHPILRHRTHPAVHPSKLRVSRESEDLPKLFANHVNDFVVRELENLLVVCARDEAAQKCPVWRRAMRKLIAHKSSRQESTLLCPGNQKSKTSRQRGAHTILITQIDRDRRRVFNCSQFRREIRACDIHQLRRSMRWYGQDCGVEVLADISRGNYPPAFFPLKTSHASAQA